MSATTSQPMTDFDRKRRAIIEGAAEVFAEKGFVAGTTKDIATKVGLSQPAIYHYAATKEVLLREIALRVCEDMLQALQEAQEIEGDSVDRLRAVVYNFTNAVIDNRRTFAVYYKEMHQLSPDVREQLRQGERAFVQGVGDLVLDLQKMGRLPAEASSTVITEGILGMVSWVYRWYRPEGPLTADAIAGMFLQLLGLHE